MLTTPAAPLVSVIVPLFNGERYIASALASVLNNLDHHLEVIVVDDGSTDGSVEAARHAADARCRIVEQHHSGAASARNRGITESSGGLLAFLDADDEWSPDKLTRQWSALAEDSALDMVFGHYVTMHGDAHLEPGGEGRPGYSVGTMLIRRASFLRVGAFATGWRVGEFLEWFARAEDAGLRHVMQPDIVLGRRVHGANLTGRDRAAHVDYARILGAIAARRRR